MIHHNYLVVVGRVDGAEDDVYEPYQHTTIENAVNLFIDYLRGASGNPNINVYIRYVITSASFIDVEEMG